MTLAQYHLFAALFDAALAVDQADDRATGREYGAAVGLQLRGKIAGAALCEWAAARRREVRPRTMEVVGDDGRRTWTCLSVLSSRCEFVTLISVHLDDEIVVPVAEAA